MKNYILLLMFGIQIASSSGAPLKVNGFDKIIEAYYSGKYFCLNKNIVKSYWEYPTYGKKSVIWQTQVVPANAKGQDIVFSIACGLGTGKSGKNSKGIHTVFINGKKLGQFTVSFKEKAIWNKGAIVFQGICLDGNNDLFGVMKFTVPANLIDYGKAQKIKVQGGANKEKTWFMLSAIQAPDESKIKKLKTSNNIAKKIKLIQIVSNRFEAENGKFTNPQICKWFGNKKAAVSVLAVSPKIKNATVFNATQYPSPDAALKAVDKAIEESALLVEVWSNGKVSKEHNEYLTALECEIWLADIKHIQNYIKLRKNLKLQQKRSGNIITVSLRRIPEAKLINIPLTIYLPIPDGMSWVEVTAKGKKIPIGISEKGFIFSMTPASFPAILKLEK